MTFPTTCILTACFAAILERAKHGESFAVTRNGEQMARILPPEVPTTNGAAVLAFLQSWEPDKDGFTDDIIETIQSLDFPHTPAPASVPPPQT